MKFRISSADGQIEKYKLMTRKEWFDCIYKFGKSRVKQEFDIIEINTLEELLELMEKTDTLILSSDTGDCIYDEPPPPEIKIYNDYIE